MHSVAAIDFREFVLGNNELEKINLFVSFVISVSILRIFLMANITGQVAYAIDDGAVNFEIGTGSSNKMEYLPVPPPNISRHNEAHLAEYLLTNYNSAARPVRNITSTTVLQISFYIVQILKLVSTSNLIALDLCT